MRFPSIIFLIVSVPALWFFPKTASIVILAIWVWMSVAVILPQVTTNFSLIVDLTEDEARIAKEHAYFFRSPLASVALARGAYCWRFFAICWAGYLWYVVGWWFAIVPTIVHYICGVIRFNCDPILFASDYARAFASISDGEKWKSKLMTLESVMAKLHGDYPSRQHTHNRLSGPNTLMIRRDHPRTVARNVGKLYQDLSLQFPDLDPEGISKAICPLMRLSPQANILEVANLIIAQSADHPFQVSQDYGLEVEFVVRDELRKFGVPFDYLVQCQWIPELDRSTPYIVPTADCKSLPFTLVGQWRDENSIHEIVPDGRYIAHYDDGTTVVWQWRVAGRKLTLTSEENTTIRHYYIADITQNTYCIKASDNQGDTYHSQRIK